MALKPLINKEVIILNLLEEKNAYETYSSINL